MELEAIKRIDRDGKVYMPGDLLTISDKAECDRLIALGAAKAVKTAAATVKKPAKKKAK